LLENDSPPDLLVERVAWNIR